MKNVAIYNREEKSLTLYDENGTDYIFENVKLFLKKTDTRKNRPIGSI
jgi:hypothetical protein